MLNYPITYREDKGSSLTYVEGDHNFHELDARTAIGWRDNIVQLDVQPGNPNSAALNIFRDGIRAYNFYSGQMTEGFAAFHIDHDYALDTKIYPHLHWAIQSNEVGTVRWGIEYTVAKGHGQEPFGPTTTIYIEQTTDGTPYKHMVGESSDEDAIDGLLYGIQPDTLILARYFRDGEHPNDTLQADVFVFIVDLHYQANRLATPFKRPNFLTPP
jgi:hypothetical protein